MTDRPLLMSPPMVLACLREIDNPGTGKTHTRRLPHLKGYPDFFDLGPSDTAGYDWHFRRKAKRSAGRSHQLSRAQRKTLKFGHGYRSGKLFKGHMV